MRLFLSNSIWDMVPRAPRANVINSKWIFKHKLKTDGSLDWYKTHWVLWGFTQHPGVDYDETFSTVVKAATVQTVLTFAVSRVGPCFVVPTHPRLVCQLNKSFYDLKQVPRAWYHYFASYLVSLGFMEAKSDTSLFIYHRGADTAYLLLYIDDNVLTALSPKLLQRTTSAL
jgi:hypothetical protein